MPDRTLRPLARLRRAVQLPLTRAMTTVAPVLERMAAAGIIQSGVVLAAQAFMGLIPLLIAVIAVAPHHVGSDMSGWFRHRLGLTGATGGAVQQLVTSRNELRHELSIFSVLLLLVSATSFTRALQRLYENAWRLPRAGLRGAVRGLAWLGGLVGYLALLGVAVRLSTGIGTGGTVVRWVVAGGGLLALCWLTPHLLLAGRVGYRSLAPGALLTAAGMLTIIAFSVVYLPHLVHGQERRFGTLGVVFAIQSWLVTLGYTLVVGTVVGAEVAQHPGPVRRWVDRRRPPA